MLDEFVATGSLERLLLGELLNDVAAPDGCAVLGNDVGEYFPHLLLALLSLELHLPMAVGCAVLGDDILVEFENQSLALAMTRHGMGDEKDVAVLLDLEHVAALLVEHGADVSLHHLVVAALVLVHDHCSCWRGWPVG